MDQEAQDQFAWRLFLGLVQCLFALHTVHTFVYPHPLVSTELCFAAFLISFFAMVIELSNHPTRRSFRIQASTEDTEGRWSITLEREHIHQEIEEEVGYGHRPIDHNGNHMRALSQQQRDAIEAEAHLILDELSLQNESLTSVQQARLKRSIEYRHQMRQVIAPSMTERIHEFALWQQGLAHPILAPPPYHSTPLPWHPFMGTGGEMTLMSTPPEISALQLIPRGDWTTSAIVKSLPSPRNPSGEFIGLTDASDRHYPIHFQVNHPSEAPPSYIDSPTQEQDVVSNLHPFHCQRRVCDDQSSSSVPSATSYEREPSSVPSPETIRRGDHPQLRIQIPQQ